MGRFCLDHYCSGESHARELPDADQSRPGSGAPFSERCRCPQRTRRGAQGTGKAHRRRAGLSDRHQEIPHDPFVHTGLAEVLKAQGRLTDAEQAYRIATERFHNNPVAHNGLAEVLKAQGRLIDAEQAYRIATERFHNDPVAHNGLAEVLKDQGRLTEARAGLSDRHREISQQSLRPHWPRRGAQGTGKAHRRRAGLSDRHREISQRSRRPQRPRRGAQGPGKAHEAETIYRHVLERFRALPEAVYAFTGLAGLLRRRGELDEAERLLTEAFQRQPRNEVTRAAIESLRAQRDGTEVPPKSKICQPSHFPKEPKNLPLLGHEQCYYLAVRSLFGWSKLAPRPTWRPWFQI